MVYKALEGPQTQLLPISKKATKAYTTMVSLKWQELLMATNKASRGLSSVLAHHVGDEVLCHRLSFEQTHLDPRRVYGAHLVGFISYTLKRNEMVLWTNVRRSHE